MDHNPTFTHFHAETATARQRSTTLPCRAFFASRRNRISLIRFLFRTFDKLVSFGYNEIEGGELEILHPGDVAFCPPDVKHWHGATRNSMFAHLAANTNPDQPGVQWFDRMPEETYHQLLVE